MKDLLRTGKVWMEEELLKNEKYAMNFPLHKNFSILDKFGGQTFQLAQLVQFGDGGELVLL